MRSTHALALLAALSVAPTAAADGDWAFGIRTGLIWSDGEPIGDIMPTGLFAKYAFGEHREFGMALDFSSWDAEHPAETIGIVQDPAVETVDAGVQTIDLRAWLDDRFAGDESLEWRWGAGLGVGSSTVDPAAGPVQGGGSFDIRTDSSLEPFIFGVIGLRTPLGSWHFSADFELQIRQMGWTYDDLNSGASGSIDTEVLYGFMLGLSRHF